MSQLLSKVFSNTAKETIEAAGSIVDNTITSQEEAMTIKSQLNDTIVAGMVKAQATAATVMDKEVQGNWLQKSYRPITVLSFVLVILVYALTFRVQDIPTEMWATIATVFGVFGGSRGIEKFGKIITNSVDLSTIRRKDRTEILKNEKK